MDEKNKPESENNLEIKPLIKLLKASIFSAYLKPDKSFSVIIVANPEMNKTTTIMRFSKIKSVTVHSDITYWGMMKEVFPKMKNEGIQTLIIPDLLKPMMKGRTTKSNFISALNPLIEEGVYKFSMGFLNIDFGADGMHRNLITSITPDFWHDNRRIWNQVGFSSRIIPFTYSYSNNFVNEVLNKIQNYETYNEIKEDFELPIFKQEIEIDKKYTQIIIPYAKLLAKYEGDNISYYQKKEHINEKEGLGFRHQKQFQCLLKSLALMRGSNKVEDCDLEDFNEIVNYINYEYNVYPDKKFIKESESVKEKNECIVCGKKIPQNETYCSLECLQKDVKKNG